MPEVPCRRVRAVLADAAASRAVSPDEPAWELLRDRGAVSGTPDAPELTAIGRHVLSELEVRSDRVDDLSLEVVAEQLARVTGDLDAVAKTAEYFLADLGALTPPEAMPLLRPVAVELANRRETPEELAEEFRNVWGAVEVMGGDARDRLLAAELLTASDAPMESLYAPLMTTTARLRERFGAREAAVTAAALLHLHPDATGLPALEAYAALRGARLSAEEAGLLAGTGEAPAALVARREAFRAALSAPELRGDDRTTTATFLTATLDPGATVSVDRLVDLARRLVPHAGGRLGPAALLSALPGLSPSEIANWVEKAGGIARARRLAPSDAELGALGVALVHGLPSSELTGVTPLPVPPRHRSAAILLAHAWIYRSLIPGGAGLPRSVSSPAA